MCTKDDQCASGHCVDGQCCDKACSGTCDRCDLPGHLGICTNVTKGEAPPGDAGACEGFTCSGTSACATSCSADSDCVAPATCMNGVCVEPADGGTSDKGHVGFACGCTGAPGPLALLLLLAALRRRRAGGGA